MILNGIGQLFDDRVKVVIVIFLVNMINHAMDPIRVVIVIFLNAHIDAIAENKAKIQNLNSSLYATGTMKTKLIKNNALKI